MVSKETNQTRPSLLMAGAVGCDDDGDDQFLLHDDGGGRV